MQDGAPQQQQVQRQQQPAVVGDLRWGRTLPAVQPLATVVAAGAAESESIANDVAALLPSAPEALRVVIKQLSGQWGFCCHSQFAADLQMFPPPTHAQPVEAPMLGER
jgi:hypothetical protein